MERQTTDEFHTGVDTELSRMFRQIIREEILSLGPEYFSNIFAQFPPLRLYTRDEVCQLLGCSTPTFYRIVNSGAVETVRRGRNILVKADDFDRKIDEGYIGKYRRY